MSQYASFSDIPLSYIKNKDISNGVAPLNEENLTVQDIFKTPFLFLQKHHKDFTSIVPTILNNNVCDTNSSNTNNSNTNNSCSTNKLNQTSYTRNNQNTISLSNIYFSSENTQRIQKLIKQAIFIKTNKKFRLDSDQDPKEIFLSMKAVFIENAQLNTKMPIREVKRLNNLVVETTVPGMLTHILQYYGYLKDINQPRELINRPINVNHAGRKTLPSVTRVFF
jgi:hypothetical protein